MDDFFPLEIYAPDAATALAEDPANSNDTRATADLLGEGVYDVTGQGHDWYRIEAQPGIMEFTLTPEAEPLNMDMALYDSNGNRIQRNVAASGPETIERQIPTSGTYYLRVYYNALGDNPPADTDLSYTLSVDLPEVIADDGNDTRQTATALDEGTRRGIVGTGIDWWKIDSVSGQLSVTMNTVENLSDPNDPRDDIRNLNMELYDADGQFLRANLSSGTTETIEYLLPKDGTYYVKVYTAQFVNNTPENVLLSYNLTLDLPEADTRSDGNDSIATAETLGNGTFTETQGIGTDWYRIDTGPGRMDFSMTHTGKLGPDGNPMNLNMRLYDAAGNPVRSDFKEFADEAFDYYAPVTGTYYLNVYWGPYADGNVPNGTTLDYVLNVDLPRNSWSQQLDFGPIRNASVAVYDIDNDGRDEIFVGAVKGLDKTTGAELLPGGLIVLEDTGGVKWSQTFPAFAGADPVTGLSYNTTSVTTAPVFSDINNDGKIEILVGVGADNRGEFSPAGQPGDLGGLYALDSDGNILWFHQSVDSFGSEGETSGPDGRPDGIYGAPRVFDIDADGQREVIFTSWDHYLYVLDGRTGKEEFAVDLHDTAGATPNIADLDRDGLFELIVPGDITANPNAGLPAQGGILHVMNNYGQQIVPGWDTQVGTSTDPDFRGKFEPQSLWSNPQVVDLDRNGTLEIVQGTGNFFQDDRGQYVKVWNTDGSLRFQLDTIGRTLPSPLIADLDGNGSPEIISATVKGYVHAWTAGGAEIFSTQVKPFDNDTMTGLTDVPIARQPVAVDLTGDGKLEIAVSIGSQLVVLDAQGNQITNTSGIERAFNNYAGSPVAHDIDNDGYLDLITGGTNAAQDHAVVYRWENIVDTQVTEGRIANYQNIQNLHEVEAFVERLYETILGREADAGGRNNWVDRLHTGVRSGADVAYGFIFSPEFLGRNTTNAEYVTVLYKAFFDAEPDARGFARWTGDLESGLSRADVLAGFTGSPQFANLSSSFGIRAESRLGSVDNAAELIGDTADSSVLRHGAGAGVLKEGTGAVDAVTANSTELMGQVYRLYGATLGREPDSNGFMTWYNALVRNQETDGDFGPTLSEAAGGFVGSAEFKNTYGADLSAEAFVTLLYQNVLDRAPDAQGLARWVGDLNAGVSRADVVLGFSQSAEFRNTTNPEMDSWMRMIQPRWNDVLEGGAGNDTMNGGIGSDIFVFRKDLGGADTIHGFEPWDQLQLSGFGIRTSADAIAHMTRQGDDVVFNTQGQAITFKGTTLADMRRVKYNLS